MKRFFFPLLLFLPLVLFAQDENLKNYDYVYDNNIRSVRFHVAGLVLTYPIIDLNSGAQLALSFDDLGEDVKDYLYTVVHCNADWTPSNLMISEYIDGFSEETIDQYNYSFKTMMEFTHYEVALPNEDMRFKKSGNYLLKVYDNEDEKTLVITRRFMVVEPIMQVIPRVVRPAMVSKSKTHQEIDFKITHQGFEVRNPRVEITAAVLQNGRWDNAITSLHPIFTRTEEQSFDYQNKIVFPAGKEFRQIDLRSLEKNPGTVKSVERYGDTYDVTLFKDKKRINQTYLEWKDINGNFLIETFDENDPDLESDYAKVFFTLSSPTEYYDADVYIFGGLSDWQVKPEFKMVYNPAINSYVAKVLLKQGFYNYLYVVVPQETQQLDFEETEGDWYEAENEYTILIYYRPFGARYDRILAAYTFDSRQ